ncbi:sulfotransferase [Geobacillus sp. C56-T2]|jgi:Sulfotransferase family|uniref:sulfotransferase family protein n=1 Tax=Geobacillus sp. C56-T2 TaxID=600773 RepID=UPI0011A743D2|nr:sulfotransferase [Geobacillus sp. C56-T2]NNV08014.1 sulfotransferase [Geobacillus sp. MMMUD3]TWG32013.1 sulfotransferase family protein [Geobacillus sp. C56-T2]
MTMPNFLIIGAAKSGTTSLYHYLKQHPQIYLSPIKETNFFALEGSNVDFKGPGDEVLKEFSITNIDDYRSLFKNVTDEKAIGEVSPLYLYSEKAPLNIKKYIPNVKIIAILRNPVDRAYSSFLHCVRDNRETVNNFEDALRLEEERIKNNWEHLWHYKNLGFYYKQLKRYYDVFSPNQIKVYLYEDLKNPENLLRNIFEFLDVDTNFKPKIEEKYNVSGIPKNKLIHNLIHKENIIKDLFKKIVVNQEIRRKLKNQIMNRNLTKPELDYSIRQKLIEEFREDILQLQDLINRDLSAWLK